MKRHFSIAALSMAFIATSFGQRATHAAPASTSAASHPAPSSKPALKTATPAPSKVQAARFQQVALGLSLNANQKKSVGNLVQTTRQQLEANSSNRNLSPEQQAAAAHEIKSDMVGKFVALLTPEQKKQLTAMLLKRQQQQQQSSANSSSGGSGSAPSAPDIPSVDAPSSSDDNSQQASASSSEAAAQTDSSSATAGTAGSQTTATKSESADPASDKAKSGQLTDAQLAAILNSFIQDDAGQVAAKPSGQDDGGNPIS